MDLTITPPDGYHMVADAQWAWADPNCAHCKGTGTIWTDVWDLEINECVPINREPDDCECVWTPDDDVLEELNERYLSEGNSARARDAWEGIARAIGPRRSGGRYWCGCWCAGYTVVSITYSFHGGDPARPSWEMTVRWDDGHHTTHSAPWDYSRDCCTRSAARVPSPAPVLPKLRAAMSAAASRRSWWSRLKSRLRSFI
jgi:hypothetical protein